MEDDQLPKGVGEKIFTPPKLTSEQEDLCARLDDFHVQYELKAKPSSMFYGALFIKRLELRLNPDWMSQSANSLREILYPIWSKDVASVSEKKAEAFKKYGSVKMTEGLIKEIDRVYGFLNDLTHHGCNPRWITDFSTFTDNDFDKLVEDFERVMRSALECQVDVHNEVDNILSVDPSILDIPSAEISR